MRGDPEFDADHRAVGDAAVDFVEAFARVLGVHVDEAERAVGIAADGGEDLVVLLAEVVGRRVVRPLHAHVHAEPADAHAVGDFQEPAEPRFGRGVLERTGEVAVDVPDFGHGCMNDAW